MRDRIAHFHLSGCFYAGNNITNIARADLVAGTHFQLQYAYLVGYIFLARIEKFHLIALADYSVFHFKISNNAAERVEHRIENQRLQWCVLFSLRRRNAFHNSRQNLVDIQSGLGAHTNNIFVLTADEINHLILHLLHHGGVHIYLIQHRNNL